MSVFGSSWCRLPARLIHKPESRVCFLPHRRSASRQRPLGFRRAISAEYWRRHPTAGPLRRSSGPHTGPRYGTVGHELEQILGVGTISPTQPPRPARAGSVLQAACLLPRLSSGSISQSWVYSDHDLSNLAQLPATHHVTRLAHRGVARVVVCERKQRRAGLNEANQLFPLGDRQREGFVTDDMNACREERPSLRGNADHSGSR